MSFAKKEDDRRGDETKPPSTISLQMAVLLMNGRASLEGEEYKGLLDKFGIQTEDYGHILKHKYLSDIAASLKKTYKDVYHAAPHGAGYRDEVMYSARVKQWAETHGQHFGQELEVAPLSQIAR